MFLFMRRTLMAIVVASLPLLCFSQAEAQPLPTNLEMPSWTGNDRFHEDRFPIKHPSLSLNGFSCEHQGDCAEGYGLEEVLEEVSTDKDNVSLVLDEIIEYAEEPYAHSPSDSDDIKKNTQILQARAFIALTTYVLAQNDALGDLQAGLPSHNSAMVDFRNAMLNVGSWGVEPAFETDAVKWATPVTNVARALDLYLALENAYCYYGAKGNVTSQDECTGATSNKLLSHTNKDYVLIYYADMIGKLEYLGGEFKEFLGVDPYDVQPGNWPLKVKVAIGYASLTHQDGIGGDDAPYQSWMRRALKTAGAQTSGDRALHWNYQTDNGRGFWAEGPFYLHYSLSQIIPFWHTIRINDMLDFHPTYNFSDPFSSSWFILPLNWLADLSGRLGE